MNILLGVTGSISAYRALDICRGLTKEGHNVKVILSRGAEEFVKYKTFYYLGAEKVYRSTDDFNPEKEPQVNVLHIELVKWCDKFIIAPASANTIAKLSQGFCVDLLSSCFLALGNKTCTLFPAMNTNMLTHPITQKNLKTLHDLPNIFIHPSDEGELACGDTGQGKLPKPEMISEIIPLITKNTPTKKVMITTGATIAPLDPVRFMTNPSSGLTGYELAKAYLQEGAQVTVVHGHNISEKIHYLKHLPNAELIEAHTTKDMLTAVKARFDYVDIYISTAAMSDIEFEFQGDKVKKSNLSKELKVNVAPDVLGTVLKTKTKQKVVGFAAETSSDENIFKEKWERKPVDLLIGNLVSNGFQSAQQGFGHNGNTYFIVKNGKVIESKLLTKKELAKTIMEELND